MEDSMDMDMSPLRPQNYLFGCELKADKDYHFKVDNDENEHQLSLRTVLKLSKINYLTFLDSYSYLCDLTFS